MHVFRPSTDLVRVLVAALPLLGAALIAISRLEDYRHDAYDVGVGSVLGMLVAWFSYRRYYPGLGERSCHVPCPSAPEAGAGGKKRRDDEAMVGGTNGEDEGASESRPLREGNDGSID